MTLLKERPTVTRPPLEKARIPSPPAPETRRPVRWVEWTIGFVVVAMAAATILILNRDRAPVAEDFASVYEAESGLSYGQRHLPGFTVEPRWVGESG